MKNVRLAYRRPDYAKDTVPLCGHMHINGKEMPDDELCEYTEVLEIHCNSCRSKPNKSIRILIN